jgi:multiple sugar transport system permease protein
VTTGTVTAAKGRADRSDVAGTAVSTVAGRRRRDLVAKVILHAVLIAGVVVMVAPFLWMLLSALKPEREILRVPPTWWPQHPTLDNFRELFSRMDFPKYFLNSLVVAAAVTIGNLVFASALGYALAKLRFPGRRALFAVVLGTLMVPGMVTFVPLFVIVSRLGLVNSYAGLALPFLAQAFGVFLMRQYLLSIPDDLIEAARVDGAGEFRIFWRIVLPLCRPALATLGILTFLGSWNNFLWPLVAATTEDRYTLPVALALYSVGQNRIQYGLLLAGAVVVVLPVLIVFAVLQRHFVRGIATTGLK